MTGFTAEEQMIATIAARFVDGDQACNGLASWIPVCAIRLAQLTHAPHLSWVAGASGVDPASPQLTASTFEWPMWRDAVMYVDVAGEFWDWIGSGRFLQTFCVGAAQLDVHGNANTSVIGSFDHPTARLPGTAGLGDMGSMDVRLIYWITDHSPRTLVERVDFRSGIGYLDGGDERARMGLGGGPELVVTNLATFDFEPGTHRMRLRSVHEGVRVEDVLRATGFTPVMPSAVPTTPPPTAHEVELIRTVIDPRGYRRHGVARPAAPAETALPAHDIDGEDQADDR